MAEITHGHVAIPIGRSGLVAIAPVTEVRTRELAHVDGPDLAGREGLAVLIEHADGQSGERPAHTARFQDPFAGRDHRAHGFGGAVELPDRAPWEHLENAPLEMNRAHGGGMEDQADARRVVVLPFGLENADEMCRHHLRPGHGMLLNEREATLAGEAVLDDHPAALPERVLSVRARSRVIERAVDQLHRVGTVTPESSNGGRGRRRHRCRCGTLDRLGAPRRPRGVAHEGRHGVEKIGPGRERARHFETRCVDVEGRDPEAVEIDRSLGEARLHGRVGNDVVRLRRGEAGRDRHIHGTEAGDGVRDHEPFGPVVQQYADSVARSHAVLGQPVGDAVGQRVQLAERHPPAAVDQRDASRVHRRSPRDPPRVGTDLAVHDRPFTVSRSPLPVHRCPFTTCRTSRWGRAPVRWPSSPVALGPRPR